MSSFILLKKHYALASELNEVMLPEGLISDYNYAAILSYNVSKFKLLHVHTLQYPNEAM